jgi:2-haloacid dehalogenase
VTVRAVVFDVGNVLYHWSPRALYQRLIPSGPALDAFLCDVVTPEWHFQHDAGRDFADTSAELITIFPQHEALIRSWAERFVETITNPVDGMAALVEELDGAGIPLFGITNFSHEFWPPFREKEAALFDRFQDIIVSGDEKIVKPDPAIYALALERFGLAPGEGFFIDDSLPNVESATANGFVGHYFQGVTGVRQALEKHGLLAVGVTRKV